MFHFVGFCELGGLWEKVNEVIDAEAGIDFFCNLIRNIMSEIYMSGKRLSISLCVNSQL